MDTIAPSINVYDVRALHADPNNHDSISWVTLRFQSPKGGQFDVTAFMPVPIAKAYADAINAVTERLKAEQRDAA